MGETLDQRHLGVTNPGSRRSPRVSVILIQSHINSEEGSQHSSYSPAKKSECGLNIVAATLSREDSVGSAGTLVALLLLQRWYLMLLMCRDWKQLGGQVDTPAVIGLWMSQ
ncbi:hypothetical protein E2C01_094137 [Portunus trituberculatus]|uniref:Uncharacterized protein n=1 Tax=Portunus trituberculatus TaxID=210409 RepID=A0A5B7JWT3_PORTR|nr:hypothetical protein [Portunus trituberculatus]